MSTLVALVMGSLCLSLSLGASAFSVRVSSGNPVRWAEPNIPFHIQYEGSDNLTSEVSLQAVTNGFESWMDVDCTDLTFQAVGDAPNPSTVLLAGAMPNGKNELVWMEDSTWQLGKWVLGVTAPLIHLNGELYEADIAFNGYHLKFTVNGNGGTDLESVAVHEIGHMFGMQHNIGPYSWNDPPTMAPSISGGLKSRTLEYDDTLGVCFLYPKIEPWGCGDDEDCPMVLDQNDQGEDFYAGSFQCGDDGTCSILDLYPEDTSLMGEECTTDASCVDDLYCQPWQDSAMCTSYCVSANPQCPETFYCEPFQSYPQYGACLPDDGEIKKPGVDGCASSEVCSEGMLCLPLPDASKKVCTLLCTVGEDATCPEGELCFSYGNPTGGCFSPDLIDPPDPDPDADADGGSQPDDVASIPDLGPTVDTAHTPPPEDGVSAGDTGPGPVDDASTDPQVETLGGGVDAVANLPESPGDAGKPSGGCGAGGGAAPSWLFVWLALTLAPMRRRLLQAGSPSA
jgi:hypothetical protein